MKLPRPAIRCRAVNSHGHRCRYKRTHKGRHAPPDDDAGEDSAQCGRMRCHRWSLIDEAVCLPHYRDDDEYLDDWSMPGMHVLGAEVTS